MSITITAEVEAIVIEELAVTGRLHELDDGEVTIEDVVAELLDEGFDFSEALCRQEQIGYSESRFPFLC